MKRASNPLARGYEPATEGGIPPATRFFSIPNWEDYQHYKDRDPPWIKFHIRTLRSYDFSKLPDVTKAHLMLLWLLASQLNNRLPWDAEFLQKAIQANEPIRLDLLADAGFIVVSDEAASTPLAECYHIATPEAEAEKETEAEKEGKPARAREAAPPDHFHAQYDPAFKAFMKELQTTYPEHAGRSNWRKAEAGVVALLNDGYTRDRIRGAVMRKRAFHEAKGDLGTEFVTNPGNFFADPENIDNLWRPPVRQQRKTRTEEAAEHNWQTLQALQRRDSDEAGRPGRVQQGDFRGGGVSRPQIASNGG